MEERIVELELRSTEQQRLLEDLSLVLHRQQREIAALQAEVVALRGRLEDAAQVGPAEKPPHF